MENKDWEDFLNDLTGDPDQDGKIPANGDQPDGPALQDDAGLTDDELLREKLSGYTPAGQVEGWDKIAASLDASDEAFDHQVRTRIHHYHPAYDPQSWSKFAKRFSAHKHLRTRLIVLKLSEAAAILLLMLTVLHLGQKGHLPFQNAVAEQTNPGASPLQAAVIPEKESIVAAGPDETSNTEVNQPLPANAIKDAVKSSRGGTLLSTEKNIIIDQTPDNAGNKAAFTGPSIEFAPPSDEMVYTPETVRTQALGVAEETNTQPTAHVYDNVPTVDFLSHATPSVEFVRQNPISLPELVTPAGKRYLEFGMLAQGDYNQLKMPEDRLNSDGKQIIFPLQGITSPGFGAGFTLALGHPRWAVETGVIYNSKTFRPGRELTIGGIADNSNVEYEAMHMQLISVPLQYRYRFDHKGRLKAYALAGFGLHLIAQSDIDVLVEYNFPSLPEGEDPNNDPSLARTIRQAQRVSEDIRDRAPFSKNSYISANLGIGLEYALMDRKTLFLQTAYQYQIPNLRFSNHNGKHVLSLSLQAGVRTPLGS